ncbi:MAG: cytochrome c3 family protein [Desulfofustis sp.]|nr:cytochrome c3 family protein [Desulfofustis sp.]
MYCGACHDGSTAFEVNSQCASCHLEPEKPIVWTKPVKTVIFEHQTHSTDLGLDCESCHDDLFKMEAGAAEQADDFTMASLYDGLYCGACHDGSTAFASNTRCTTCHIGVRGHARMMGEAEAQAHGAGH